MEVKICIFEGCSTTNIQSKIIKSYCTKHYQQIRARAAGVKEIKRWYGEDQLWLKSALSNRSRIECWLDWPFSWNGKNYPSITNGSRSEPVCRVVLKLEGYEPENDENNNALHKCGDSRCINPSHLYWGSDRENSLDMIRHGNSQAKISDQNIRDMFYLDAPIKEIAEKFGVNRSYVSFVRKVGRALSNA